MPAYEFIADNGDIVELQMSMAEHAKRVKNDTIQLDDGRLARTNWSREASERHRSSATCPGTYPMVSMNAGVHPDQIKEHMEHLRSRGCGQVDHTPDGDIVFNDKSQRKKVLETLGIYDRNAGYGDPAPKYRTASKRWR
jgi:hypothetical protein